MVLDQERLQIAFIIPAAIDQRINMIELPLFSGADFPHTAALTGAIESEEHPSADPIWRARVVVFPAP